MTARVVEVTSADRQTHTAESDYVRFVARRLSITSRCFR